MDYLEYYNLSEEPFAIMPRTSFYFHNEQHDRAQARLTRAVSEMKGLAVLAGDIGTGKTLLARRMLEELPEDEYDVSLLVVLHSDVDTDWLIRRIAAQFGVDNSDFDFLVFHLLKLSESQFDTIDQTFAISGIRTCKRR